MKKDSEVMRDVWLSSIKELDAVIKGTKTPTDRTKYAGVVVGAYVRLRQTETHEDGIRYGICRDISKDEKQLQSYLAVSIPHLTPTKTKQIGAV